MSAGKLCRCEILQRSMRSPRIEADSPGFDGLAHFAERREPMLVQNLVPQARIEALDSERDRGAVSFVGFG